MRWTVRGATSTEFPAPRSRLGGRSCVTPSWGDRTRTERGSCRPRCGPRGVAHKPLERKTQTNASKRLTSPFVCAHASPRSSPRVPGAGVRAQARRMLAGRPPRRLARPQRLLQSLDREGGCERRGARGPAGPSRCRHRRQQRCRVRDRARVSAGAPRRSSSRVATPSPAPRRRAPSRTRPRLRPRPRPTRPTPRLPNAKRAKRVTRRAESRACASTSSPSPPSPLSRDAFKALNLPLHLLVHNAGLMPAPFKRTIDGHERHMQVNVLAPVLLTRLLLGALRGADENENVDCSTSARVVFVTSAAHRFRTARACVLAEAA